MDLVLFLLQCPTDKNIKNGLYWEGGVVYFSHILLQKTVRQEIIPFNKACCPTSRADPTISGLLRLYWKVSDISGNMAYATMGQSIAPA